MGRDPVLADDSAVQQESNAGSEFAQGLRSAEYAPSVHALWRLGAFLRRWSVRGPIVQSYAFVDNDFLDRASTRRQNQARYARCCGVVEHSVLPLVEQPLIYGYSRRLFCLRWGLALFAKSACPK